MKNICSENIGFVPPHTRLGRLCARSVRSLRSHTATVVLALRAGDSGAQSQLPKTTTCFFEKAIDNNCGVLFISTPLMKTLSDRFNADKQGRQFADVTSLPEWAGAVEFFDNEKRQERMLWAEAEMNQPPLAGVIHEFEQLPLIDAFFSGRDSHSTVRFRQAVGVLVRVIMEEHGWHTAGRKGSLGTRSKVPPGTTTPGAYQNESGLSKWFTRAEHYTPNPPISP
jgi:hypothetical protein